MTKARTAHSALLSAENYCVGPDGANDPTKEVTEEQKSSHIS